MLFRYTFEVGPVCTIIEREVISKCLSLIGYPELPLADGIMSPGGSISNMYGMVLARYTRFPESKRKGLSSIPPLACFVSEGGHYSIMKGAHWLGIGTDNVYKVSLFYVQLFLTATKWGTKKSSIQIRSERTRWAGWTWTHCNKQYNRPGITASYPFLYALPRAPLFSARSILLWRLLKFAKKNKFGFI